MERNSFQEPSTRFAEAKKWVKVGKCNFVLLSMDLERKLDVKKRLELENRGKSLSQKTPSEMTSIPLVFMKLHILSYLYNVQPMLCPNRLHMPDCIAVNLGIFWQYSRSQLV